jgi:hypothetical protein
MCRNSEALAEAKQDETRGIPNGKIYGGLLNKC